MSFYHMKSFSIKKDGVSFCAASSNVRPRIFQSEKCRYHTQLLMEKGKDAVIKRILWQFVIGSFQAYSSNATVRLFEAVADTVRGTEEFKRLDNIYWCWDNAARQATDKENARENIMELLFKEYTRVAVFKPGDRVHNREYNEYGTVIKIMPRKKAVVKFDDGRGDTTPLRDLEKCPARTERRA